MGARASPCDFDQTEDMLTVPDQKATTMLSAACCMILLLLWVVLFRSACQISLTWAR